MKKVLIEDWNEVLAYKMSWPWTTYNLLKFFKWLYLTAAGAVGKSLLQKAFHLLWHLHWFLCVAVSMLPHSKPHTVQVSISLHLHCLAKQSPCPISPWTMRNGCQLPRVCLPLPTMCYIPVRSFMLLISTNQNASPHLTVHCYDHTTDTWVCWGPDRLDYCHLSL